MARSADGFHFLSGKTVFIAGAGLSGTAFAASLCKLWKANIPPPRIVIFERDGRDCHDKRGGYSLSLVGHDMSGGLIPLKRLGLLNQVLDASISGRDGCGAFKIWSPDWSDLGRFQRKPAGDIPTSSIRISRNRLRHILRSAATADQATIQWDSQCISAKRLASGRVIVGVLRGDSGTVEQLECDFLIAADGAHSKLRSHLRPNDVLQYTGAVMRGGVASFDEQIPCQIGRNWGFVLSRTGVSCFVSPVGERSVLWAVGHFEEQTPPLDKDSDNKVQQLIKQSLRLTSYIHEPMHTIISRTDPETVMQINANDKTPFRHDQIVDISVVFIGDSNHALSPFAGYGANLGLNDAWDLAEQLVKHDSLEAAVGAYDDISVPRAAKVLCGARKRLKAGHSTGVLYYIFVFVLALHRLFGSVIGFVRGER